jgi:hypothetical protein
MKKLYDAVVTTGKYTDRTGKEKNRYLTVGAVFEGEKGISLKLEALPTVGFSGWINFYEPKERGEQKPEQKPREPAADDFGDAEIPF